MNREHIIALVDEARRTHAERAQGYERLVAAGKLDPETARARTNRMEQIVAVLEDAAQGAEQSDSTLVSWQGEVMLSNWSETASAGRKVEFWLPEGEGESTAEHPFKLYTRRHRGTPGTIFLMQLIEIGDDGQVVPRGHQQIARTTPEAPSDLPGGRLSQNAGRLCKDSDFHAYLKHHGIPMTTGDPEATAADYVRQTCDITSRRLLDHSREAQLAYENRVVEPFIAWIENLGEPPR